MADNLTPLPVKTKTDGDVAVDIAQYGGAATGASNAVHIQPGTGATFVLAATTNTVEVVGDAAENALVAGNPVQVGGRFDATPRTLGDGDVGGIALAADGAVHVDDGGNALTVDNAGTFAVQVDAALPAGDANIGNVDIVTGPTGTGALEVQGTAADGVTAVGDPVQVGGVDGSGNMQSVTVDTSGHLQVDVLTGGGSDTPTTPTTEDITSVALAAGASADLDSTDVAAATKKLSGIDIWASVPWKARIMTVANAVETIHTVLGGPPMVAVQFRPPHRNYIQQGPVGAGFDGFRVEVTNLDNVDAADCYATFYLEE